jgi:hypothetical protein
VLSALLALGLERSTHADPPPAGARVRRGRWIRHHRGPHRCDRRGREKGGRAVGLTRKGKGSQSKARANGAGLPLAVTVERANPPKTALVDATVEARLLRRKSTSAPTVASVGNTPAPYGSETAAHVRTTEAGDTSVGPTRALLGASVPSSAYTPQLPSAQFADQVDQASTALRCPKGSNPHGIDARTSPSRDRGSSSQ